MKTFAALLLGCIVLLPVERAEAQSLGAWWGWALPEVRGESAQYYDDREYDEDYDYYGDRDRYARRPRQERGVAVPAGHLPPPGECRLWYYDRPPGQQPPPIPCNDLGARRYAGATVVTHRGVVGRSRRARPHRTRPHRTRSYPTRSSRAGWEVVVWGDIVFRRGARWSAGEIIGAAGVEGVLGRLVVDRLRERSPRATADAALRGRWIEAGHRGRALQVRAGGVPVAELSDVDGDGRVDAVLLAKAR